VLVTGAVALPGLPLAIARAGAVGGSGGVALASTVGYTGLLAAHR
jgi:hypothetical protein